MAWQVSTQASHSAQNISKYLKISPRVQRKNNNTGRLATVARRVLIGATVCPRSDQCIMEKGDESLCKAFIEAHNQCLRDEGFNIK
eukprot:SAG31_NODE_4285_length_3381_cov_1.637112_4_plen_86_part_00